MNHKKPSIGILGAGKFGTALARLAVASGYEVFVAGSKGVDHIALTIEILVPHAQAMDKEALVKKADIIILALPLGKYETIPTDGLKGKLVIDAMNYWMEVDGLERIPASLRDSSSELVERFLPDVYLIKAFNHMGYHDIEHEAAPLESPGRKAIAFAGDYESVFDQVKQLIDDLGFDPLYIGSLKNGIILEPGSPLFGANLELNQLKEEIEAFNQSEFGKAVLETRGGSL